MSNPYTENTVFGRYWQDKIRQTNQLIRENPEIHSAFSSWYSSYIQAYAKPPAPSYTIEQVERLLTNLYKRRQAAQALANTNQSIRMAAARYKRPYPGSDPFAGISDAEANAAADAALRTLAAKRRRIYIRPSSLPSRSGFNRTMKMGELKGVDTIIDSVSITNTTNTNGNIHGINLINQGSGSFNRIGRKTYPRSVRITGNANFDLAVNATTGDQANCSLRCILVWDRQPNQAALPQFDAIFGHTNGIGTESSSVLDALRYDNMQRFKILKEWIINCPLNTTTNYNLSQNKTLVSIPFDEFYTFKLKKYETTYASTQSDPNPPLYTDIATGGLFIVFRRVLQAHAFAGDSTIDVTQAIARFRYTD